MVVCEHIVYLGVDPSIGAASVTEGDNASKFTLPVSTRTDQGAPTVSRTRVLPLLPSTDHVVSHQILVSLVAGLV